MVHVARGAVVRPKSERIAMSAPSNFAKPYYYSRWLYCTDRDCKTTTYMQEKFKVWNDNLTGTEAKASAAAPETEGDLRQIPQP